MGTQENLRAHKERAAAALSRGDLDEGAQELARAIYLDPRDVILRQRLADLLARMGRDAEAVVQFQQVAGHYAAKGELLKAIAICRTILDLEPKHQETQAALARLYARRSAANATRLAALPSSMSASAAAAAAASTSGEPRAAGERAAPLEPGLSSVAAEARRARAPAPSSQSRRFPPKAQPTPAVPDAAVTEELAPTLLDLSQTQRTPLFSMLDEDVFSAVIEKLALKWVKAGEVIVQEGQPGDAMYVVVQGEMHVVRGAPKAEADPERVLASLGEGAFFGEMALVGRSPRLATVVAATDGLLLEIDRAALAALALQHPDVERVLREFHRDRLLANLLAVSPLFHFFSPAERRRIAERFTLRSLPAGTAVLEQGREGSGLFCILRGQCQPIHTSAEGVETAYPRLREGDVFGEISLLFDTLVTATVRALTQVELLELPAPAFRELVLPHKQVREMIDRLARDRLAHTTDLLMERGEVMESWLV